MDMPDVGHIVDVVTCGLNMTSSLFSQTHKKKPAYVELRKEIGLQVNAFHFVISVVNSAKPEERCFKCSYITMHGIIIEYILYFSLVSWF